MRLPLPSSHEIHVADWRDLRAKWTHMRHLETLKMTTRPPMSIRYEQTKRALWSRMLVRLTALRREPVRDGLQAADYYGPRNDLEELAARGATMEQTLVTVGAHVSETNDEAPVRLFTSEEITRGDADAWISRLWHAAAERTHHYREKSRTL